MHEKNGGRPDAADVGGAAAIAELTRFLIDHQADSDCHARTAALTGRSSITGEPLISISAAFFLDTASLPLRSTF